MCHSTLGSKATKKKKKKHTVWKTKTSPSFGRRQTSNLSSSYLIVRDRYRWRERESARDIGRQGESYRERETVHERAAYRVEDEDVALLGRLEVRAPGFAFRF